MDRTTAHETQRRFRKCERLMDRLASSLERANSEHAHQFREQVDASIAELKAGLSPAQLNDLMNAPPYIQLMVQYKVLVQHLYSPAFQRAVDERKEEKNKVVQAIRADMDQAMALANAGEAQFNQQREQMQREAAQQLSRANKAKKPDQSTFSSPPSSPKQPTLSPKQTPSAPIPLPVTAHAAPSSPPVAPKSSSMYGAIDLSELDEEDDSLLMYLLPADQQRAPVQPPQAKPQPQPQPQVHTQPQSPQQRPLKQVHAPAVAVQQPPQNSVRPQITSVQVAAQPKPESEASRRQREFKEMSERLARLQEDDIVEPKPSSSLYPV
eukprot:c22908_g1_i1.p1 GENE.c22908_g1_i1~~c22908_g1_i1.p1  ORF type:complete len:324 (-),score=63.79 c22908_g1_i1:113-1084(-)